MEWSRQGGVDEGTRGKMDLNAKETMVKEPEGRQSVFAAANVGNDQNNRVDLVKCCLGSFSVISGNFVCVLIPMSCQVFSLRCVIASTHECISSVPHCLRLPCVYQPLCSFPPVPDCLFCYQR